jgi:hypothetical protein
MCGIFAYLNYLTEVDRQTIADILTNGLQRLEYRGYDSAGKFLVPFLPFAFAFACVAMSQKEIFPRSRPPGGEQGGGMGVNERTKQTNVPDPSY